MRKPPTLAPVVPTPFARACYEGHVEVVKMLLADARINIFESHTKEKVSGLVNYGYLQLLQLFVLHTACKGDLVEVVKALLEDGRSNPNEWNKQGVCNKYT